MTKKREQFTCPCENYTIKMVVESDDKIDPIRFCPICGIELPEEEESEED